jgi:hypothetical protein
VPSWPTATVVMPCDTCVVAARSFSRLSVEWLWASMKPGASTRPVPSTTGSPGCGATSPTAAIVSPSTRRSARRSGAPVPSAICAPAMTKRSGDCAAGSAKVARAAVSNSVVRGIES